MRKILTNPRKRSAGKPVILEPSSAILPPMRRLTLPLIALLLVLSVTSTCGKRGDLENPPLPSGFQAS